MQKNCLIIKKEGINSIVLTKCMKTNIKSCNTSLIWLFLSTSQEYAHTCARARTQTHTHTHTQLPYLEMSTKKPKLN